MVPELLILVKAMARGSEASALGLGSYRQSAWDLLGAAGRGDAGRLFLCDPAGVGVRALRGCPSRLQDRYFLQSAHSGCMFSASSSPSWRGMLPERRCLQHGPSRGDWDSGATKWVAGVLCHSSRLDDHIAHERHLLGALAVHCVA